MTGVLGLKLLYVADGANRLIGIRRGVAMELAELLNQTREERLNEVGTMPPCPFCQKPRVQRSDYVRCNPCGTNWLEGEDLSKNPLLSREPYLSSARGRGIKSSETDQSGIA